SPFGGAGEKSRRTRLSEICGQAARGRNRREKMADDVLARFARALASGAIRVVDLTQPLDAGTATIQLPPEFGRTWPFRLEEISRYDSRGPAWYWNNFACGEHTGTHFDAPIHWVSGKDYPGNATDTIAPEK